MPALVCCSGMSARLLRAVCGSNGALAVSETYPWVIGEVVAAVRNAPSASQPYDSTKDLVHFEAVKSDEPAFQVKLSLDEMRWVRGIEPTPFILP